MQTPFLWPQAAKGRALLPHGRCALARVPPPERAHAAIRRDDEQRSGQGLRCTRQRVQPRVGKSFGRIR